ncbi:MAG: AAA family ATPase [Chloroflexota bacterium]|nr:AAA family ATPase [Chloroflexota bacterium]
MICANCGTENRAGRRFCAECGTALAAACPNCGAVNEAGEKFCGQCGTRLSDGAATQGVPVERAAALGGASGATGASSASATNGGQRQAERRLVSVMFADLVGFTSLSEARDAEEVRELLSRYFELARESVGRYGGTIEKFIGDAVMAVWGTPTAHEDDAERAVRAALELVEAVTRLGGEINAPDLALRAGVLTGEAAVTLGAEGQGMVAGDLVNTASRLQSVATPGTVLVGEATYRSAQDAIAFEPVAEQALKGKALPVAAWQALRVVAKRGGVGRSEALEPPFVGRDEELRVLKDQLEATGREQRPRLLSIVGMAGIGKSRLAWEFLKYVDGVVETVYWHQGRCPAYGEGVTFWALAEMIRQRAGIAETDDPSTARERLSAAAAEYAGDDGERRWIEPRLATLLGLEEGRAGEREELFAAWRTFFQRIAEKSTTVLLFEDLQWADTGLLDFIEHLLEWSRNSPLLVITLARPELLERRQNWGAGQRSFTNLRLEPLPDAAMHEMLEGLVPGLSADLRGRFVARAEGVPMYAVETVRMLLARGQLRADEGRYTVTGEIAQLDVPDSLHAVIAARLDALDAEDRRLLQDASVLGQTFTTAALASIRASDSPDLEARLRSLVRRELLVLDADPRSPERGQYGFVQALVREVAYNTLSRRDRRARHLAAARYFETLGDESLTGALASHFLDAYRAAPEGEEGDAVAFQARRALRAAAERAAGLGSYEQALTYLEEAVATGADDDERAALNERAGTVAFIAGRQDDAQHYLRAAADHYRLNGDRAGLARATTGVARSLLAAGRVDPAIELANHVSEEVGDIVDEPAIVGLSAELARAYGRHEEFERALEYADRALVGAERLGLTELVAEALTTRATVLGSSGRRMEALVILRGVLQLAETHGLTATELRIRINLSLMLLDEDPAAALAVTRIGLQQAERLGFRAFVTYLVGNGSDAAWRVGDWDWAVDRIEELLPTVSDPFDRLSLVQSAALIRICRAELTEDEITEIEEPTRALSDPLVEANNLRNRAWLGITSGEWEMARERASAAAAISPVVASSAHAVLARAALWQRDIEALRASVEELRTRAHTGRGVAADYRTMSAGVHALAGETLQAVEAYREAMGLWRDLGCAFDLALCELDFAYTIGPDDADARAAGEEAREIFTRLRTAPFVARAESVLRPAATRSEA